MEKLSVRPYEAAKMLSISERTLATWTKKEGLPCTKVGRIILYSIPDLARWLELRKKGAD
ncbi:DNA-binding protein [bacterium]|nr:DNA-binding protein [bacterium]NBT63234.1 DNA-binding protein [Planctomycetia bacterium]